MPFCFLSSVNSINKLFLLSKYLLISNTFCPVLYINDATTLKAMFLQNMLHDFIIPMRIHPDIRHTFKAPVQAGFRHPFS